MTMTHKNCYHRHYQQSYIWCDKRWTLEPPQLKYLKIPQNICLKCPFCTSIKGLEELICWQHKQRKNWLNFDFVFEIKSDWIIQLALTQNICSIKYQRINFIIQFLGSTKILTAVRTQGFHSHSKRWRLRSKKIQWKRKNASSQKHLMVQKCWDSKTIQQPEFFSHKKDS